MARRTIAPLAYSEYVAPDLDDSEQVWQARTRLIESVKRVYPRLLEKLAADVFPTYCRLAEQGRLASFKKALWSANPYVTPWDALPGRSKLKVAMSKWVVEFNVAAWWLILGAFRTLRDWYVAPDWRKSLKWNAVHPRSGIYVVGEDFEFRYRGWEPTCLTWPNYSKSLHRRFEAQVLEYEKKTRVLAESHGLIPAQRKYSPDNLDWFVLYQFAGLSSKRIADRCSENGKALDESTVLKGIKATAKLTGWRHLRESGSRRSRKIR